MGEIACEDLLRVVPFRRITCVGYAGEKQLIVKLFFARNGAKRHWKRSDRGCGYFIKKDIPAPAVLYSGYLSRQNIFAMVFEYLKDGVRLKDCLEQAVELSARNSLLDALMEVVARQHEAGIIQHDLHLGNFMIADGTIYSLDGDHVSNRDCPADRSESFRNLAYLFAQNIFVFCNGIEGRVMSYAKHRNWHVSKQEMEEIKGHIRETRSRIFRKYRWKVARKESRFIEFSKGVNVSLDIGLNDGKVLGESIVQQNDDDRAGGFRLVSTAQGRVPVVNFPGYGPMAMRWFWKVCRIWRNMSLLKMLGLNAADSVFIIVRRGHFWQWNCSMVFRPVAGPTVREMFLSGSLPESQRLSAVSALSEALCCLRDTGVVFSPMNPDQMVFEKGRIIFLFAEKVRKAPRNQLFLLIRGFLQQWDDLPGVGAIFEEQFRNRNLLD